MVFFFITENNIDSIFSMGIIMLPYPLAIGEHKTYLIYDPFEFIKIERNEKACCSKLQILPKVLINVIFYNVEKDGWWK